MKDKYLLIISIFIAVSIWLYVFSSENREAYIQVPIKLIETRDGTIASVSPKEVSVRVKGPRSLIYSAIDSNTTIDINVSERPTEMSVIRLSPNDIRITGVEIIEITPTRIELTIQKTRKATVKFQPLILGQPKRGYKVVSAQVLPESAEVEGLPEDLTQLKTIQTQNINIDGIDKTTEYTVAPTDYSGIKAIIPDNVSILVEIAENIVEQRYTSRIACSEGTGSRDEEDHLPSVEVTVKGRIDLLDAIQDNAQLVETNCDTIDPTNSYTLTILPKQFDNYEITKIQPNSIKIETE